MLIDNPAKSNVNRYQTKSIFISYLKRLEVIDRAVYVGRNADRIARYMSACCDRDAHKYMFEHPGKYAMRSTTKDYCITIVRREIQDAFDVVYPARELGKGNIKQMA